MHVSSHESAGVKPSLDCRKMLSMGSTDVAQNLWLAIWPATTGLPLIEFLLLASW